VQDVGRIWEEEHGEITYRLDYELNRKSFVIDAGGHLGGFASNIYSRFRCKILIFEPVQEYFDFILSRFMYNPDIQVRKMGLANQTAKCTIRKSRDISSIYLENEDPYIPEDIRVTQLSKIMKDENIEKVDLLKLNVEGSEYDVFDDIFGNKMIKKFDNIQVQFHEISGKSRTDVQDHLEETHELTYNFPYVFENWKLK